MSNFKDFNCLIALGFFLGVSGLFWLNAKWRKWTNRGK